MAALHVCATPINRAGQYTTLPDATQALAVPVPGLYGYQMVRHGMFHGRETVAAVWWAGLELTWRSPLLGSGRHACPQALPGRSALYLDEQDPAVDEPGDGGHGHGPCQPVQAAEAGSDRGRSPHAGQGGNHYDWRHMADAPAERVGPFLPPAVHSPGASTVSPAARIA